MAGVLVLLCLLLLLADLRLRGDRHYARVGQGAARTTVPIRLGAARWPALLVPAAVVVLALGVPSWSLLHWLRRMLLVRREHPAFGMGEFRSVDSGHESVFAFVREFHPQDERHEEQAETLVCIFNLSHTPAASTAHTGTQLNASNHWCVAMASSVGRPVMTTVTSAAPDSPNNQPCLSLLQSP